MKIRIVMGGYVANDTHCDKKLLGLESVPKRNFVSSLQGYGNSLEQVLCFQGFEGDLCYSSAQIGNKFCGFTVSRSSRFDGYWHEVVRGGTAGIFC